MSAVNDNARAVAVYLAYADGPQQGARLEFADVKLRQRVTLHRTDTGEPIDGGAVYVIISVPINPRGDIKLLPEVCPVCVRGEVES